MMIRNTSLIVTYNQQMNREYRQLTMTNTSYLYTDISL